ncbi:hypothetical protein U3A55_05135 [Salarchaeum sp. III]|uniref:hypothetical protein n=1 Tax=Salarchaeum sp. III TaxID=3107927 RepID=UPI002ED803A0
MVQTALVYLGFVLTPLPRPLGLRLLLRSGLVTDGAEDSDVWFTDKPQTLHTYWSRFHKGLTWATFFGGWFLTLILSGFL